MRRREFCSLILARKEVIEMNSRNKFYFLVFKIEWVEILHKMGISTGKFERRSGLLFSRCFFHSEKTPSFVFFQKTGTFKCFGCGEQGNKLRFVKLFFHWDSPKTIRWFHKCFGTPLPWKSAKEKRRVSKK